jgi:hypothetical protein
MKSYPLIFVALTAMTITPSFANSADWPISLPEPVPGPVCQIGRLVLNTPENIGAELAKLLLRRFDARCLSNPKARATFSVEEAAAGNLKVTLLKKSHTNDADIFYCEQSIWETVLSKGKGGSDDIRFDIQTTVTFKVPTGDNAAGAHWTGLVPSKRGQVKLHFVPVSVVDCRPHAYLDYKDIDASQNIIALPLHSLHDKRLGKFRQEWLSFLLANPQLTRDQLMAQVKTMRGEYKSFFIESK